MVPSGVLQRSSSVVALSQKGMVFTMLLDETVTHYLMVLENRCYSPYTLTSYRRSLYIVKRLLSELCDVVELEIVTVLHLRQCVRYLLDTHEKGLSLSASSVHTYIRRWKAFFNWSFKEELISKSPVARLEYPKTDEKLIDTFTEMQIEQMLGVFDLSTVGGFRDYVIILLMIDTGLRRSKVVSLCVEDVHETYISVFGKGRKERQVGVHPQISNLLWKYIRKYRHPASPSEPALFLSVSKNRAGLPFGRGGIGGLIDRLKAATGIDDVRLSAHTFRHTFACMYLDEGGDLFSLSRELGHKDIKTTEKYLKSFTSKNARKRHNDHSPINRIKLRKGKGRSRKSEE
jgi:integrase/recombinase XerD